MYKLIACFFLIISNSSFAQKANLTVVPIGGDVVKYYYNYNYDSVGLMSNEGKILTPNIYPNIFSLGEGYYAVQMIKNSLEKFFVIDKSGKKIAEDVYKLNVYSNSFKDGYAITEIEGKGKGLVDKNFKIIIPNKYFLLERADKNWYYVRQSPTSPKGIIDVNQKQIIPEEYKELLPLSDGLMAFKKDKEYGYINLQNKVTIADTFKYAGKFMNGFARVETVDKVSTPSMIQIIDKTGNPLEHESFTSISYENQNGIFIITKGGIGKLGAYYLYDAKTNKIISDKYDYIENFGKAYRVRTLSYENGLINASGKIIFALSKDDIMNTPELDFYKIKHSGKLGLIKESKIVIEPKYDAILMEKAPYFIFTTDSTTDIYNSTAKFIKTVGGKAHQCWVNSKNELYLFFGRKTILTDLKTKNTITFRYNGITEFNKAGFALIDDKDGKIPIDINGKKLSSKALTTVTDAGEGFYFHQKANYYDIEVLNSKYEQTGKLDWTASNYSQRMQLTSGFSNGYCIVKHNITNTYGFYDVYGKPNKNIKESYKEVNSFNNGRAFVRGNTDNFFVLIDTMGKVYDAPKDITSCSMFKDGFALIQNSTKKIGVVNTDGKKIIDYKYDQIGIGDGIFSCKVGNKYSILKSDGSTLVTEGTYDECSSFENGYAQVKKATKIGLINKKGVIALPCQFDQFGNIAEDMVWTKTKDKLSLYSISAGKKIIEADYDGVGEFQEGYCIVKKGELYGLVDKMGKLVLPFHYTSLNKVMKGKISGIRDSAIEKIQL